MNGSEGFSLGRRCCCWMRGRLRLCFCYAKSARVGDEVGNMILKFCSNEHGRAGKPATKWEAETNSSKFVIGRGIF